jgi:hypothetical protein
MCKQHHVVNQLILHLNNFYIIQIVHSDIFLAVDEWLEEEQDNEDYAN